MYVNAILCAGWIILCLEIVNSVELPDFPCDTNVYLEVGKRGIVPCRFQSFDLLGWINGDGSYGESVPFIFLENSEINGRGYESGDYNMLPDGSLIINNVQLKHEFNFTVSYTPTVGKQMQFYVLVKVFVVQIPVIDGCYSQQEDCNLTMPRNGTLACSVLAVPLKYRMDISLDMSADASGLSLTRIKDYHHPHTSGDTYDLTTSYQYTVDEGSTESVIKCSLSGMNDQPMDSMVIARIIWQDTLNKQKTITGSTSDGGDSNRGWMFVSIILIVVFLIIIIIIIIVIIKFKKVKIPEKESVPKSESEKDFRAMFLHITNLLEQQTQKTETDFEGMFLHIIQLLERQSPNAKRVSKRTFDDSIILRRSHHNSSGRSTGHSSSFDVESLVW